jgi:BMFP domain-containing protein YqiC
MAAKARSEQEALQLRVEQLEAALKTNKDSA